MVKLENTLGFCRIEPEFRSDTAQTVLKSFLVCKGQSSMDARKTTNSETHSAFCNVNHTSMAFRFLINRQR